jgi:hypothetical protein
MSRPKLRPVLPLLRTLVLSVGGKTLRDLHIPMVYELGGGYA